MNNSEKLQRVLANLPNIQDIKLEDGQIFNEYSVIVLYENDSEIIICNNSEEANCLYGYLMAKIEGYKSKRDNQTEREEDSIEQ